MNALITKEIADAMKELDRPLQLEDATGQVYYVLTKQQFRQYVYDDSDLTSNEMIAAAACGLDDYDGWGSPGMEVYDQNDVEKTS